MDSSHHQFHDLFEQLGLPSDEASIRKFCAEHRLHESEKLSDAEFLNDMQKQFIKEALHADADWAVVIDQLNMSLHHVSEADHAEKLQRSQESTPG